MFTLRKEKLFNDANSKNTQMGSANYRTTTVCTMNQSKESQKSEVSAVKLGKTSGKCLAHASEPSSEKISIQPVSSKENMQAKSCPGKHVTNPKRGKTCTPNHL